jgi:hypothetical protein
MKKATLLSSLILWAVLGYGQSTWTKHYSLTGSTSQLYNQVFGDLDAFYIQSSKEVLKTDRNGVPIKQLNLSTVNTDFLTFSEERTNTTSGLPYFLIAKRVGLINPSISIAEYIPGIGIQNELILNDPLGSVNIPAPFVLPAGSDQYIVFGKNSIWQLNYQENLGFDIVWEKPLGQVPTAVAKLSDGYLIANSQEELIKLDLNGSVVWTQTGLSFTPTALTSTATQLIACGQLPQGSPTVAAFDFSGNLIWSKTSTDYTSYSDITTTSDGGFALAGIRTSSGAISLIKLDAAGEEIWNKEFEVGTSLQIQTTNDGAYLLTGLATNLSPKFWMCKTDAAGNTGTTEKVIVQYQKLETDSTVIGFMPKSNLFTSNDFNSLYHENSASKPSLIFTTSPWIGGFDPGGNLHLAADQYFMEDFATGVGSNVQATEDFKRIWAVDRDQIQALLRDFEEDQELNNEIPIDILEWPGRGNPFLTTTFQFEPITTNPNDFPAPFFDRDGDNIYNVYNGDYPLIKGDRMLWWTLTDDKIHNNSTAAPLKIDMQISAYTVDCGNTGEVENSVWIDFEVINRAAESYDSTFFGLFSDVDLGCYHDDYLGTSPESNMVFAYNEDNLDEDCSGVNGFGQNIPVETIAFINKPLDRSIYINNAGFGQPPANSTDPITPIEFYNLLNGVYRDGVPQETGNYTFPGNPSDPGDTSMCTVNLPLSDRRLIHSHGPFTLHPADTFLLQTVFTYHANIAHPCPDIELDVRPRVDRIHDWKNNGTLDAYSMQSPAVFLPAGGSVTLAPDVPNADYLWSDGSMQESLEVTAPGLYQVTITNEAGCVQEQEILVHQTSRAHEQLAKAPQWNIFPNPNHGRTAQLLCTDCSNNPMQFRLFTMQGQLVSDQTVDARQQIQLPLLPPGVYTAQLFDKGVWIGSRKLVVLEE